MAHPYEHPVEKLLATAQESAKLLWRNYDLWMARKDRGSEWRTESRARFEQVMAADARVWRLQALRDGYRGGSKREAMSLVGKMETAITALHGCACSHQGGFFVDEQMDGGRVWSGVVEIFGLQNHREATHAFAWAWDHRGEIRYEVLLRVPPVCSPRDAVFAAVAAAPHDGSIPQSLFS